jgi:precorrin isomerase
MEVTDNTKTLANALAEIKKLRIELITSFGEAQSALEQLVEVRQKLEAAEDRIIDLKEVIVSYGHLAASDARKINELESELKPS